MDFNYEINPLSASSSNFVDSLKSLGFREKVNAEQKNRKREENFIRAKCLESMKVAKVESDLQKKEIAVQRKENHLQNVKNKMKQVSQTEKQQMKAFILEELRKSDCQNRLEEKFRTIDEKVSHEKEKIRSRMREMGSTEAQQCRAHILEQYRMLERQEKMDRRHQDVFARKEQALDAVRSKLASHQTHLEERLIRAQILQQMKKVSLEDRQSGRLEAASLKKETLLKDVKERLQESNEQKRERKEKAMQISLAKVVDKSIKSQVKQRKAEITKALIDSFKQGYTSRVDDILRDPSTHQLHISIPLDSSQANVLANSSASGF